MNTISIKDLSQRVVGIMLEAGFRASSAWFDYDSVFAPIIRMHNEQGCDDYNKEIVSRYIQQSQERYEKGLIAKTTCRHAIRCAKRLIEVNETDTIQWKKHTPISRLNDYYTHLLNDISSKGFWGEKRPKHPKGYVTRYFTWLQSEGHPTVDSVDAIIIKKYVLYCSKRMSGQSLGMVKGYLKKIHYYLAYEGHTKKAYDEILSFPVSKDKKIIPAVSYEEVVIMLDTIDKTALHGERDYTILLLGAVTGLRAVDIAHLKLTDIDWQNGEIRITQAKTGNPLALPLTEDVGIALRNYILHCRIDTGSEYVFNRIVRPMKGHITPESICYIYKSRREKAGLVNKPGQGFHSLRRALGLQMVTSGVPITMVAQVFGSVDIESVKPYIALDSANLKECALDLTGIEQTGGDAT